MTDEDIMIQVKSGDIDKLSILFEKYHTKLYNHFLRHTYNKDLSEDLTQNLFLRILKYRQSYNDQFSFRTWMYQIARNIIARHYEQQKLKYDNNISAAEIKSNLLSTEEEVDKNERYELLYMAMNKLNSQDRELLMLSRFEGLKYHEIAEVTDLSVANIKVKIHRAMHKLKEMYLQTT